MTLKWRSVPVTYSQLTTARLPYPDREFLASPDVRFRPVNAYTAPDGTTTADELEWDNTTELADESWAEPGASVLEAGDGAEYSFYIDSEVGDGIKTVLGWHPRATVTPRRKRKRHSAAFRP